MDPCSIQRLAANCGGELRGNDAQAVAYGVCTDSRQIRPGDLFVCLRGPNFDGHEFAAEAVRKGAVAVLGEAERLRADSLAVPVILVHNARQALGRLAAMHRRQFRIPVIAVAGSNGKTTTKELVASVVRQRFPAVASEASFNNDIGVPMTLLGIDSSHGAAVVEIGTNHPGEMRALLELVQPTHGVLTRLGREHLEFFEDMDGVIREEGTLAEFVAPDGKLFLVGDSPGAYAVSRRARAPVVTVGWAPENDWTLRSVTVSDEGTEFEVSATRSEFSGEYELRLLGCHQVENGLLAAAVGAELGLSRAEVHAGLAACQPAKRRLQLFAAGEIRILDDSYNANADSMRAALATLRDLDCAGRRVAVLGDMGELGAHAPAAHLEVGRYAARMGVDCLFAVGQRAEVVGKGAREAGLLQVHEFAETADAAEAVLKWLEPGDLVLVKASRASRLDVIADLLRRVFAARGAGERPATTTNFRTACSII